MSKNPYPEGTLVKAVIGNHRERWYLLPFKDCQGRVMEYVVGVTYPYYVVFSDGSDGVFDEHELEAF